MRMKKVMITAFLVLVVLMGKAQVQPTTALLGSWSGKLNVGTVSLTLVLHLDQADGYVLITLDSPDQGAKGIGTFKEYLSDDSLAIKVEHLGMTYRAKLKDGKLDGTFAQNGMSFPLVLTRGDVAKTKRPQMPAQPYPYDTEEVTFRNEADGATLAGTLTWPVNYDKSSKKKPVVVLLVSGSGPQNRDEELFEHKPFLVIADYLARQGIASLRYDDRATGKSVGGELKNATSLDFMRDASAGLDSLAGPGVKGDTLLAAQENRIMSLSGLPANMTVERYRQQKEVKENPWLKWFVDYDPTADIKSTRCPVFALNGDRDCQVIASQNLNAIRQLLPKSNKNLVKEYLGLNHLFQHCTTGLFLEYGNG